MAHANAIFLSLLSGAALVLGLAPGCSNNATPAEQVAIVWTVSPGTNSPTVCGAGGGDTWTIGDPEAHPIATATSAWAGVPVSVNCTVSPNSSGFSVTAEVTYGNEGSFSINGQIKVTAGQSQPGTQTGITGSFNDHLGLIADMSSNDGTVTFTKNGSMGAAAMRIWGAIDCPQATATDGTVCDGNAEFLFENCTQ